MAYKRTYDEYDGWDADEEFYEEDTGPAATLPAPAGGARRPERKRSPRRRARLSRSAMAAVLMTVFSLGLCIGRLALPKRGGAGTGQSGQKRRELSGTGTDGAQTDEEKTGLHSERDDTKYPQAPAEVVQKNPETLDFVYDYPHQQHIDAGDRPERGGVRRNGSRSCSSGTSAGAITAMEVA